MADVDGPTAQSQLQTPPASENQSLLSKLNTVERYWTWKAGIRTIICVLNIIAIGCAAWLFTAMRRFYGFDSYWYYGSDPAMISALVVLPVSFVWCFLWLVIPTLLKPPRPLHPGIAVGLDLIFWLAFIVAGLFTLTSVFSAIHSDANNYIGYSYGNGAGINGEYVVAPNGTLVYNITSVRPDYSNRHYNSTTGRYDYDTPDINSVTRDCTPQFSSCQEQDAAVNEFWRSRHTRAATAIVANVVEWLGVLFHFTLFVWACVDTHRYNRTKNGTKEKMVADKIIEDLERRGLISVQNGVIMQDPNQSAPAAYQPTPQPHQQPQQQHGMTQIQSSHDGAPPSNQPHAITSDYVPGNHDAISPAAR